jgi:hypothetical protein
VEITGLRRVGLVVEVGGLGIADAKDAFAYLSAGKHFGNVAIAIEKTVFHRSPAA